MTRYFNLKVLTTFLLSLFLISSYSQDLEPHLNPKYGPDSLSRIQCAYDLSTLAEFMEIDLPDYALPSWRKLFANCPASRKNIYISGAKIFQHLIEKETVDSRKAELFDTLMLIYDKRIEYFGDEAYVLGRKGVDIIKYNQAAFPDAYSAFKRSTELSEGDYDLNTVTGLIQTGAAMYQQDMISTEEFLGNYMLSMGIFKELIDQKKSIAKVKRAENVVEKIIENINIKDAEGIEKVFAPVFEKDGENSDMIKLAIDLMTSSGFDNTPFFAETNERLMKLDPDPSVAYEVAKFNLQNENFTKATEFLELAIKYEEDPNQKALYLHQMALVYLSKLSNPVKAREYAMEAIKNKPDWGEPYFIVASALIEGIKSCNVEKFDRQAIYWLAVDYCIKAKAVDPTVSAKANDLISQYKNGYPNVEETFFRSLKEGDNYSFGCWINESTRVKSK